MAKIYFVRDGSGENQGSRGHSISMEEVTEEFSRHSVEFQENRLVFNPEAPVDASSPYKHVVLVVKADEENSKFPRAGFYRIVNLEPNVCARKFGIYY